MGNSGSTGTNSYGNRGSAVYSSSTGSNSNGNSGSTSSNSMGNSGSTNTNSNGNSESAGWTNSMGNSGSTGTNSNGNSGSAGNSGSTGTNSNGNSGSSSTSTFTLTMSFSYSGNSGNMNSCVNISSQLDVCAQYLSPDDYYNLQTSVADYEAKAIFAYNTLSYLWPSDCSSSLWQYSCKAIFQPRLCTNTDNSTTLSNTSYCYNDCLNTLQNQCLNGSQPNPCQMSTCTTVSNLITECSNTTQAIPSLSENAYDLLVTVNETRYGNSGNMMKISWVVGLLLIMVNWLVTIL
jgi:hypothetical protein